MPSNHLIFCRPLLLLPLIFPSIRVFSNESALPVRWPKYWSFSFRISPSNEYSGLISFRMDWLDLLAVQSRLVQFFFQSLVFFKKLSFFQSFFLQIFWSTKTHSGFVTVGHWSELNSCKWRPSGPPAPPPCTSGEEGAASDVTVFPAQASPFAFFPGVPALSRISTDNRLLEQLSQHCTSYSFLHVY